MKNHTMKAYLVLCIFAVFGSPIAGASGNELSNFNMDEELSPEDLEKLKELVAKEMKVHDLSRLQEIDIVVLLNDYLDKFLENVHTTIIKSGLDPTSLPNQYIDIGIGHTNLTEGQLNDTATIQRYRNATLSYDNNSKRLTAEMVLRFEDLKFLFKYHTKVTLISMTGHLHGEIQHIHIHVKLEFDFSQGLMSVDSIDFKHTGNINVWVSGNALVDWIVNAMTSVITGILHNLILDVVKNIVANPINSLVDAINHLLHPSVIISF